MKFKFSLQSVLDARHSKVESLEIQLGQLNAVQRRIKKRLEMLHIKLGNINVHLQDQQKSYDMDLFLIGLLYDNIAYTELKIKESQEELKQLEIRIEAKRNELIAAKQDEEVMEILRDKEYNRLLEALEAAERKEVDDIYISKAYRDAHRENTKNNLRDF